MKFLLCTPTSDPLAAQVEHSWQSPKLRGEGDTARNRKYRRKDEWRIKKTVRARVVLSSPPRYFRVSRASLFRATLSTPDPAILHALPPTAHRVPSSDTLFNPRPGRTTESAPPCSTSEKSGSKSQTQLSRSLTVSVAQPHNRESGETARPKHALVLFLSRLGCTRRSLQCARTAACR